ncbi:MAG: S26 family signal peptidase [Hyphomonadaceae bacterium]|nr:S26 family signal peptidase [Hyphomonadaceae bacterium]
MLWLGGAALALAALVLNGARQDVVLFNHSPSVPVGLYIRESGSPDRGMFVTVRARDVAPLEAAAHHYDDESDRFIKRLAAVAGQHVCSDGRVLSVDGVEAAVVQNRAGAPQGWVGCRTLAPSEILLLGDSADSFDGRYWGPIRDNLIEGVWRPL